MIKSTKYTLVHSDFLCIALTHLAKKVENTLPQQPPEKKQGLTKVVACLKMFPGHIRQFTPESNFILAQLTYDIELWKKNTFQLTDKRHYEDLGKQFLGARYILPNSQNIQLEPGPFNLFWLVEKFPGGQLYFDKDFILPFRLLKEYQVHIQALDSLGNANHLFTSFVRAEATVDPNQFPEEGQPAVVQMDELMDL